MNVIIDPNYEFRHHEHSDAFAKHLGNDSAKLIQLGTNDIVNEEAVAAVRYVEELGKRQQQGFRKKRIIKRIVKV